MTKITVWPAAKRSDHRAWTFSRADLPHLLWKESSAANHLRDLACQLAFFGFEGLGRAPSCQELIRSERVEKRVKMDESKAAKSDKSSRSAFCAINLGLSLREGKGKASDWAARDCRVLSHWQRCDRVMKLKSED